MEGGLLVVWAGCALFPRKHASLPYHKLAVLKHFGLTQPEHGAGIEAPSESQFESVWQHVAEKGCAPSAGIDGVGGGKKVTKMAQCLAEGNRELDRDFMRKASMLSLKRDERAGRLAVHFRAGTP